MIETVQNQLETQGFAMISEAISHVQVDQLRHALDELATVGSSVARRGRMYAARNLLEHETMRELASSDALLDMVAPIIGDEPFCVRGILFDKLPEANWHVGWHQDRAIPVRERVDLPGFGPWSVKAGVVHVEPPIEVLDRMVTLRVHLDDCDESNGALRVLAGSHRAGRLAVEAIREWVASGKAEMCSASAGSALAMKPLLLHASSRMEKSEENTDGVAKRRRVIHLEYAVEPLPGGLEWHDPSCEAAHQNASL